MRIATKKEGTPRHAVSSVLATVLMLAMLFTSGMGFFIYTAQSSVQSLQAGAARNQAVQQAASEKVAMLVGLASEADPWGNIGDLWVQVNNTGNVPVTLVDVFVTSSPLGILASKSQVTPNSNYLQLRGTLTQMGDLNVSLPIAVPAGYTTAQLKGCGPAVGCDIAISKQAYTYGGTPVVVSVLTSSGNVFSAQYPPPPSSILNHVTSVTTYASTSTSTMGNPGGNVLVVQMSAAPSQTYSCSSCVTDTVTVYNYGLNATTGVTLTPSPPLVSKTGTLTLTYDSPACVLQGGSNNLPAYSGTGVPPSIVYVCSLSANPNGFGGFASFIGSASGTYEGSPVTSGVATSNTIQIGGPLSVLNQGPFSANFFYFKYSACTNAPQGFGTHYYSSPGCTTTPSPVTVGNLLDANEITGSSSYYVAFYGQITNNFNVTIPILPYSFFFTDATVGSDTSYFITGNPSSLPYIPDYSNASSNYLPSLTPYPSSCYATSTASCINLAPGQTVTLTFAACDISSTWWNWAGSAYGRNFDSGNTCTTLPPGYASQVSTYGSMIISFVYKGQVYTQDVPFIGLQVN